jgi:hypothetical protein
LQIRQVFAADVHHEKPLHVRLEIRLPRIVLSVFVTRI